MISPSAPSGTSRPVEASATRMRTPGRGNPRSLSLCRSDGPYAYVRSSSQPVTEHTESFFPEDWAISNSIAFWLLVRSPPPTIILSTLFKISERPPTLLIDAIELL